MSVVVRSIKIIKQDQRELPDERPEAPVLTQSEASREVAKIVSSWVVDRRKSMNNAPRFPNHRPI